MFSEPSALKLSSIYNPIVNDELPSGGGRRFFVGDLQGCCGELEDLLESSGFIKGTDVLYPVGDLVNRGPESRKTLELLREIEARPVLGNHDLHTLHVREGARKLSRQDTISDLLDESEACDDLLRWLAAQPLVRVHADFYQVHAALHPTWKNEQLLRAGLRSAPRSIILPKKAKAAQNHAKIKQIDISDFVTRTRFTNPKGFWPSKHDKLDDDGNPLGDRWKPWYEYYSPRAHAGRLVIYGHWAQFGLQKGAASLGLDSGCVWGGELTAWIAEEQRFVAVPARERWAGNFRPR
jgi:bis(5'-nucleosyl)-tetraphosphatase (symmetrical)